MRSYQDPVCLEGGTFNTFTLTSSPYNDGRRRRKHNKTFTGCIICKKRKVRCTEEKPSCARCVRTKTKCSYKPPTIWVFDPSESDTKQRLQPCLPKSPGLDSHLSRQDRRALSFYRERAAPIFSCFFGKDFWNSVVLQMSQHHVPIRELSIGAAALFESIEAQTPEEQLKLQTDFFNKYSRAVSTIANTSQEQCPEMILTASVMFANFEMITGSIEQAIIHVKAGMKITQSHLKRLKQSGKGTSSEARFIASQIQPNIAGHALQAHIYGMSFMPMHEICEVISEDYQLPSVPKIFAHLHQAFSCLAGIVHHIVLVDSTADIPWALNYAVKLEHLLDRWKHSFEEFEETLSTSEKIARQKDLTTLHCNEGLARIVVQALQYDIGLTDLTMEVSSAEYRLLYEYMEMGFDLQDCMLQFDYTMASESTSLEYTPPIIMVTTSNSSENDFLSQPSTNTPNSESKTWSTYEALATAQTIISQHPSSHSTLSTTPLDDLHSELLPDPLLQVSSNNNINVEYLRMPQQLSHIGLLIPRLPPSIIAQLQSAAPVSTCSWMPLEYLSEPPLYTTVSSGSCSTCSWMPLEDLVTDSLPPDGPVGVQVW